VITKLLYPSFEPCAAVLWYSQAQLTPPKHARHRHSTEAIAATLEWKAQNTRWTHLNAWVCNFEC
jgi:hypothetical protein